MDEAADEDDWETGALIFGWEIGNHQGSDLGVAFNLQMSVKKYVADLKTKDPSR